MKKTQTPSCRRQPPPRRPRPRPDGDGGNPPAILRFSPYAWGKFLFFRDRGPTEIGGFGITSADDLLYVEDFRTVRQEATVASIRFDDDAVAGFFDDQVDAGHSPAQFARVWCHTHPGTSARPSVTDEETFARVFGACDHALMVIVARGGEAFARLRFNVGPGGNVPVPVEVDFSRPFGASSDEAWKEEYEANIRVADRFAARAARVDTWEDGDPLAIWDGDDALPGLDDDLVDDLSDMEPAERRLVLAEMGYGPVFATQEWR